MLKEREILSQQTLLADKIKFFNVGQRKQSPFVRDGAIFLPRGKVESLHLLHGGKQFLCEIFHKNPPIYPSKRPRTSWSNHFCGLDERALFTTALPTQTLRDDDGWKSPFQTFLDKGEAAFYESLKPEELRLWEQRLGIKSKRQGDVYALPFHIWRSYLKAYSLVLNEKATLKQRRNAPICGTRHRLAGQCTRPLLIRSCEFSHDLHRSAVLAVGQLKAPDHKPLVLDEVHLIMTSITTD